jgi:hypothetical protein
VGGKGGRAVLELVGAGTDPGKASAVVVGPGVDPSAPARLALRGSGSGPASTFHATTISLIGGYSQLEVSGNQQLDAARIEAGDFAFLSPSSGTSLSVLNGATVNAGTLEFDGVAGNALLIDGASLKADATFTARGLGNDSVFRIQNGGSLRGSVDARAVQGASLLVDVSGGTFAFLDHLSVSAGSASQAQVDLSGSDMVVKTLADVDAAAVRVLQGSSVNAMFTRLLPNGSRVVLDGVNQSNNSASTWFGSGFAVGSDLVYHGLAPKGGDLSGPGAATLDVLNGAQLAIFPGADPGHLAIGSQGIVNIDPTSSIVVGESLTGYHPIRGKVLLEPDGELWGNGTINGVGFSSGTHLDVVNQGGVVHPGFSPGRLTIDGAYKQSDGVLALEIGGVNAGEYDVLDAALGASFLGGKLRFERINNFAGVIGAQLDFFAGRRVSFGPGVLIEDNTGLGLAFDFVTGIATITRFAVPEPPVAALMLAGSAGFGWMGRRRAAR